MSYRVIACGVNKTPKASQLDYAEKDATDISKFFTSALGPVDENQIGLLTGRNATAQTLRQAFKKTELQRPTNLVFYFSGHGSSEGVHLSDGLFEFGELIAHIRKIDAKNSITILDSCSSASYLDFIKKADSIGAFDSREMQWLDILAQATPGARLMFSTGPNRTSIEGGDVANGHFTFALLKSLQLSKGDISHRGASYISDQRAFSGASRHLRKFFGARQQPVERYLTGDFALAISQSDNPIGAVEITRVASLPFGTAVALSLSIEGRKNVPTIIDYHVRNVLGRTIASGKHKLAPSGNTAVLTRQIGFESKTILKDPVVNLHHIGFRSFRLEWVIKLKDQHGKLLGTKIFPVTYRPT